MRSFLDLTESGNPRQVYRTDFGSSSLNLSSTPISLFPEEELIVYWKGLCHLSSNLPDSRSQKISLGNLVYSLIKEESFLDIERDYLGRNRQEIDRFRDRYLRRLASENSVVKERYDVLRKSVNEDSLDSLVKNYFFSVTRNIDIEKIILDNEVREKAERKIDASQIPNIEFNHRIPLLDALMPEEDIPVFITGKKCYSLSPELRFLESVKSLERRYKEYIADRIKDKIKKSVEIYFKRSLDNRSIDELDKKVRAARASPGDGFGVRRISDNEYVLFKEVGEYGVEWNDKFYLFPPLKVGINLVKTSAGYRISNSAFAFESPYYKHPYIQGSKGRERRSICSAGTLDRIHSEIEFISASENNSEKAHLMKSAKALLLRFENILVAGHNSSHDPFDTIQNSAQILSDSEVRYYQRRGVMFFKKI